MDKVIVGMSGGVDSAVAAYLLKNAGYDVIGVTLRVWQADDGSEGRCCDIDDARSVAYKLGIPYYPINCVSDFNKNVVDTFINEYLCGRTPNPCVECNRFVKWEKLMFYAKVIGANYIATGHYASIVKKENGRFTVRKALHGEKDQTYMLYKLTQEQLAYTIMPLGNISKQEVRKIAKDLKLPIASKPDSQEVCFVSEGSYADFITSRSVSDSELEGNFVDENGNTVGRHKGIFYYTVGQRKGLGIALGYPAYVKEIRSDKNEVVIGSEQSLYSREIMCGDMNFMSVPGFNGNEVFECMVKVRYRHSAQPALVQSWGDGLAKITFVDPVRAATPGQSAVFYDYEGCVIGGGKISSVLG